MQEPSWKRVDQAALAKASEAAHEAAWNAMAQAKEQGLSIPKQDAAWQKAWDSVMKPFWKEYQG